MDVVVDGDPEAAARAVAAAQRGPVFPLSEAFGAWRALEPRPPDHLRRLPAPGRDDRGGPGQARLHRERDGASRWRAATLHRPPRRRARPARRACCGCWARRPTTTTRCAPLRLVRLAAELGFGPDAETERLTAGGRAAAVRALARARVRRAAPPRDVRRLPGRAGAGRPPGRARRRPARADRAEGRRAEPLPPPRRATTTRSRCWPSSWSWISARRSASSRLRSRPCWPSRWPTSSPAARRCASARCSTTSASPRRAASGRTAGSRSSATTPRARRWWATIFRRLRASERLRAYVGQAHPRAPGAGLPGARAPAVAGARCTPTCAAASPSRWRSRCSRAPTGMATRGRGPGAVDRGAPGAGARGDGRGAGLARSTARRSRRCAATSWRASWSIEPGPELGRLLAELEAAVYAGRGEGPRPGAGARRRAAPESAAMIVDCAVYEHGVAPRRATSSSARPSRAATTTTRFVWIGLHEPTEEEFDSVRREFHLHELAVEDAIHAHQRPKLEVYGDTIFVVLKTARYVDSEEVVEFGEILIFTRRGLHRDRPPRRGHRAARRARGGGERPRAAQARARRRCCTRSSTGWWTTTSRRSRACDEDIEEVENEVFSPDRDSSRRAHLQAQARGAGVHARRRAARGARSTGWPQGQHDADPPRGARVLPRRERPPGARARAARGLPRAADQRARPPT